jgi:hypothetical protein
MGVAANGSFAELRVTRPDGVVVLSRTVRLVNPPDLIEHEVAPTPAAASQVGFVPNEGSALIQIGG